MHSEQWGLTCGKTPCFSAKLVQEGNRLHFLADRAEFSGDLSDDEALRLDRSFSGDIEAAGTNAFSR